MIIQIPLQTGSTVGYLAKPNNPNGKAVIVLQEWWGLVDHIKDISDRFAKLGFVALAPDLYNGVSAKSPDEAGKLMMALNISEAEKTIRSAIETVLGVDGVTAKTVGIVGFCMGGQLAVYSACANPNTISACVNFYGIHPSVTPDYSKLQATLLGFFAELDKSVPPETVNTLASTLQDLQKDYTFKIFENTHHAFFNDSRPQVYNKEAATECWDKMIELFINKIN
jgi:carboxymethylenebutenolidase